MATGFTTIGHSNRGLDEFMEMLRQAGVDMLIDVRSFPRSRKNPVFNIDRLPADLALIQIGYRHCPALGGRRPRQPGIDQRLNAMWRVQSFHNYADYALDAAFGEAFDEMVRLGHTRRVALMCSEAVWWRCHRRIITDYLLFSGEEVTHLMAIGRSDKAKSTPGAQRLGASKVIYPAEGPAGDLETSRDSDHGFDGGSRECRVHPHPYAFYGLKCRQTSARFASNSVGDRHHDHVGVSAARYVLPGRYAAMHAEDLAV